MRRQRLHALCGRWQATLLERQCALLLPSGAAAHAPSQGALLFTLAWLQSTLASLVVSPPVEPPPTSAFSSADGSLAVPGASPPASAPAATPAGFALASLDATHLASRRASTESLTLIVLALLEPYPFAPQQRVVGSRDLHGAPWRQAAAPLLRQVLRASHHCTRSDADVAMATHSGMLQRLKALHGAQLAQEAAELLHGSERWQERLMSLHELEMERRDELHRNSAQQERQVRLVITRTRPTLVDTLIWQLRPPTPPPHMTGREAVA